MPEIRKRILVLGLGGAGCNTVARIAVKAPSTMEFAVMDCDAQTLDHCQIVEKRIAIGNASTDGLSSGGDSEVGRRCAEQSVMQLEPLLSGVDLLMIIVSQSGGFGAGAAPVIARLARSFGAMTLFFSILPFPFEGDLVRDKANKSLRKLRTYADAIIQMPNDRIQPDGDLPLSESLARSSGTLAAGVVGLWRMLAQTGVYNLDFASLHTMLHYCDATCCFSCASGTGESRADELIKGLKSHPLVDGQDVFEKAPGMIVGISGGDDLKLSEVQQILEGLTPKNKSCWLKMGVSIDPASTGKISAMVLAAEAWTEPLVDDGHGGLKPVAGEKQGELAGVLTPRSRRFGGAERTVYRGEDLDTPTYIRRKIKLPR